MNARTVSFDGFAPVPLQNRFWLGCEKAKNPMKAEIKGLGGVCLQARRRCWARHSCHEPVRQMHQPAPCLSLFWASHPKAFPITSPSTPVVSQGYFFTSNTSKEGTLMQAQLARSSSQPCCHVLPLPGITLTSSLQAQVHLSFCFCTPMVQGSRLTEISHCPKT